MAVDEDEPVTRGGSLASLVLSGLLAPATVLLPARDSLDATAVVNSDGTLTLDDVIYDSPSGAAHAVVGYSVNGWRFWLAATPEGVVRLDDRRQQVADEGS